MLIPEEYITGNKKLDARIARSIIKYPHKTTRLQDIMKISEPEKKGRMSVSEKDLRTYKDGTLFASQGEMNRWDFLLKIQAIGEIKNLRRQVTFLLQESFIHKQWGDVEEMIYVADFTYFNVSFRKEYQNRECVEDAKGKWLTDIYKHKRKLFLYRYGAYLFFEVHPDE